MGIWMMLRKRWRNNSPFNWIILFSFTGTGIVFGLLLHQKISLTKEINPFDILSIFVTLFIAYYIGIFIENDKIINKSLKELFITKISELEMLLGNLYDDLDNDEIPLIKVTTPMKKIRKGISLIYSSASNLDLQLDNKREFKLGNLAKKLLDLSTYTPPVQIVPDRMPIDLEIKENQIIFRPSKKTQIFNTLDNLKNELFQLKIELLAL